jgi:hypothetical protein
VGSSKKRGSGPERKARKKDTEAAQVAAEIRRQAAALYETVELLRAIVQWNASVQQQLEVLAVAQRRTNSLLELALGSALDVELDTPHPRPGVR